MQGEISNSARNILNYVNRISEIKRQINPGNKNILKNNIDFNLDLILKENQNIFNKLKTVEEKPNLNLPKPEFKRTLPIAPEKKELETNSISFKKLTDKNKKQFMKELNISDSELKNFIKNYKNTNVKELKKIDYTIYKPSSLGEFANKLMKKTADNLIVKYPNFFKPMFGNFLTVEMELLSRSYVSMMLLFTLLSFPGSLLFFLILNFAFKLNIGLIILISFLCTILTFVGFYFYPASLIGQKGKKIKLELPFALVHMSAVAGSGAQPLSIFELIAESEEYPELRKEIKKIMNYVNLFGYNLSNALRNVSNTTASPEFKELLNGMISTIETGGDLKGYLKEKADDALNIYRLDRKKQIEALATYSEVYTSILIAAPLLLLVTFAIINSIGGKIGGLDVKTVAWVGIAGILPVLNVGFMFFVNASQKGL